MSFDMSPYEFNLSSSSSSSSASFYSQSDSSSTAFSTPIAMKATKSTRSNNQSTGQGSHATLGGISLPDSLDVYSQHLTNRHRHLHPEKDRIVSSDATNRSPSYHGDADEIMFNMDLEQTEYSKQTHDVYNSLGYNLVRRYSGGQPIAPSENMDTLPQRRTRQETPKFHPLRYKETNGTQTTNLRSPALSSVSSISTTPPTPVLSPRLAEYKTDGIPLLYDQIDFNLTQLAERHCEICFDPPHHSLLGSNTIPLSSLKDPVSWVAEELRGVTLIERIP
jgi:hypothetical protein